MRNNLLPIAKEGWKYIGYSILAIFIFSLLGFGTLEFLALFATAFFIYIFRNPERESLIYEQNSVVSPVDGTVISIDEIKDDNYAYKLCINSTYLDVSLLRVPLSSDLISMDVKHGSRLSNFSALSQKINEKIVLTFEDKNNNVLKVDHMLKQSIVPIHIDIIEKQKLLQGSRYGVMVNGITTLYLPQNFRINVSVGTEVNASQALIGYFS